MIMIGKIKGDDHKTKKRMGKSQTLELFTIPDVCGAVTTLPLFGNLICTIYENDFTA